ncbi:hypothetical protein PORCRE_911 [Porphyromonas crevioricanis JCM 15906]|uniref:Uncharacterized protein n=1 Tax=Porphyromonas crevioricanis JCM 15906 TaxID=1305617 RepID=T1CH84_9PORP|nr:hypothetical protein PORCRE_911 [Porphyromonas crevioricanis JCM 15906]
MLLRRRNKEGAVSKSENRFSNYRKDTNDILIIQEKTAIK